MLRQLEIALLAVIVASAPRGTIRELAVSGTCAPSDARSERLIASFKAFVGKTDMGGTIEKTTMGVKTVTPAQVALVTDRGICTRAAEALDKTLIPELKRSTYALYVIKLGSSYAVEDTRIFQADFETARVFDSKWKYIGVRQI
jgi:hypothetical protein